MTTIRPDARERLSEAITLIGMIQDSPSPKLRSQHLARLQRILDSLRDSLIERES